jgi:hypothetical protein
MLTVQRIPKPYFPPNSLLVAMLSGPAQLEARRAARRLRAEGAPAVSADSDIIALARGLADSEISRSPAVLEAVPPLFWLEAEREGLGGDRTIQGWVVEKKQGVLIAKGFQLPAGIDATPEAEDTLTLVFGSRPSDEDDETRYVRGLVAAICLPEVMAQMGESSPVALLPAEAQENEASALRGFRLSVAMSPASVPT